MEKLLAGKALFDSTNIVAFILKWRKHVIIVGIIAAIISGLASYLIEPKFQSKVVLFPTSAVSISKSLLKEWDDVLKFGEEKDAQQMLQILTNSDDIRLRITEKYNLEKRYKVEPNDPYRKLHLKQEFLDRVWFYQNPFYSIEINVLDRSPDTAAFIANDIAALIDSTKNKLQKERAMQVLKIVEDEYLKKKSFVEKLQDSLRWYTNQGIFDYETQSEVFYKQYVKDISKNNTNAIQQLDNKLKLIGNKGWEYVALRDFAYHERNQMFSLMVKYDQAKLDVDRTLPSKYIITPAIPAEKRISPNRVLIVIISTISSMFLAIISILILDRVKTS